ncbi:MAG: zinc ABC transporter substrate-binding protein [Clostridia bacterium]|nr:zinc ABC transporter substrate-binding protein [Clostridia bacterium]
MKYMKKRIIAIILCALALIGALSGCEVEDEKLTVLCTVFPVYDWVRAVVGESKNIEVKLLVSDGADLHSFQPTAKDAISIKSADLVVRVGGADDSFVNELVTESADLRLMEAEGVTLRHMSVSSEHSREDEHEGSHGHEHAVDEHIWLSLKNASACVDAICEAVCELDAEGAEVYRENTEDYINSLNALDAAYSEAIANIDTPRMIFADRFPFVYMTEDYGIEYEAAFEGCTTDAEAGFDTVLRLASRAEEWGLSYVFVTESSDGKLARSVSEAVSDGTLTTVTLNSMQSLTSADIAAGESYLGIAQKNLAVLSAALAK